MLICPENWNFQQHPLSFKDHYSRTVSCIGVLILVGKLSKLSTTTMYCTPPKSVPFEVRFEFSDHSFRIDSVQKGKAEPMKLPL
jgi:hypothetical protein